MMKGNNFQIDGQSMYMSHFILLMLQYRPQLILLMLQDDEDDETKDDAVVFFIDMYISCFTSYSILW